VKNHREAEHTQQRFTYLLCMWLISQKTSPELSPVTVILHTTEARWWKWVHGNIRASNGSADNTDCEHLSFQVRRTFNDVKPTVWSTLEPQSFSVYQVHVQMLKKEPSNHSHDGH